MAINRRQFIKGLSVATGGLLFFPGCHRQISFWRVLTDEEAKVLIAMTEQIIPADDFPGATEAGVVNFIDKQLAGFYAELVPNYQHGLAGFQQYCIDQKGKEFQELEWDIQTNVLKDMEANRPDSGYWKENSASQFFNMVRTHTMQGFYGSPRHGGNKNYVSYKMMRIDYPHVLGRNIYTPRPETLNVYSS